MQGLKPWLKHTLIFRQKQCIYFLHLVKQLIEYHNMAFTETSINGEPSGIQTTIMPTVYSPTS